MQVPPDFPDTEAEVLLQVASEYGLEGAVFKRADSVYLPGKRSRSWIKCPLWQSQEVVIGAWTPGNGGRASPFGSLLLGAHDEQGRLVYIGRVGAGSSSPGVMGRVQAGVCDVLLGPAVARILVGLFRDGDLGVGFFS